MLKSIKRLLSILMLSAVFQHAALSKPVPLEKTNTIEIQPAVAHSRAYVEKDSLYLLEENLYNRPPKRRRKRNAYRNSQGIITTNYSMVGGSLGFSAYSGEEGVFRMGPVQMSASGFYQKRIAKQWHVRSTFIFNQAKAKTDEGGLAFKSNLYGITQSFVLDLLPAVNQQSSRYNTVEKVAPYLIGGIGIGYINSHNNENGSDWGIFDGMANIGVGVRYPVTPQVVLSMEGLLNATSSDYLDGYSKEKSTADYFSTLSITVAYRWGKKGSKPGR